MDPYQHLILRKVWGFIQFCRRRRWTDPRKIDKRSSIQGMEPQLERSQEKRPPRSREVKAYKLLERSGEIRKDFSLRRPFSVQWGGAGATSHGENQWLLSSLLHSGRNSRQDFQKKIFANWRWLGLNSLNEINHYIQTRLYEKQEAIQSMLKCLTGLEVGFQA